MITKDIRTLFLKNCIRNLCVIEQQNTDENKLLRTNSILYKDFNDFIDILVNIRKHENKIKKLKGEKGSPEFSQTLLSYLVFYLSTFGYKFHHFFLEYKDSSLKGDFDSNEDDLSKCYVIDALSKHHIEHVVNNDYQRILFKFGNFKYLLHYIKKHVISVDHYNTDFQELLITYTSCTLNPLNLIIYVYLKLCTIHSRNVETIENNDITAAKKEGRINGSTYGHLKESKIQNAGSVGNTIATPTCSKFRKEVFFCNELYAFMCVYGEYIIKYTIARTYGEFQLNAKRTRKKLRVYHIIKKYIVNNLITKICSNEAYRNIKFDNQSDELLYNGYKNKIREHAETFKRGVEIGKGFKNAKMSNRNYTFLYELILVMFFMKKCVRYLNENINPLIQVSLFAIYKSIKLVIIYLYYNLPPRWSHYFLNLYLVFFKKRETELVDELRKVGKTYRRTLRMMYFKKIINCVERIDRDERRRRWKQICRQQIDNLIEEKNQKETVRSKNDIPNECYTERVVPTGDVKHSDKMDYKKILDLLYFQVKYDKKEFEKKELRPFLHLHKCGYIIQMEYNNRKGSRRKWWMRQIEKKKQKKSGDPSTETKIGKKKKLKKRNLTQTDMERSGYETKMRLMRKHGFSYKSNLKKSCKNILMEKKSARSKKQFRASLFKNILKKKDNGLYIFTYNGIKTCFRKVVFFQNKAVHKLLVTVFHNLCKQDGRNVHELIITDSKKETDRRLQKKSKWKTERQLKQTSIPFTEMQSVPFLTLVENDKATQTDIVSVAAEENVCVEMTRHNTECDVCSAHSTSHQMAICKINEEVYIHGGPLNEKGDMEVDIISKNVQKDISFDEYEEVRGETDELNTRQKIYFTRNKKAVEMDTLQIGKHEMCRGTSNEITNEYMGDEIQKDRTKRVDYEEFVENEQLQKGWDYQGTDCATHGELVSEFYSDVEKGNVVTRAQHDKEKYEVSDITGTEQSGNALDDVKIIDVEDITTIKETVGTRQVEGVDKVEDMKHVEEIAKVEVEKKEYANQVEDVEVVKTVYEKKVKEITEVKEVEKNEYTIQVEEVEIVKTVDEKKVKEITEVKEVKKTEYTIQVEEVEIVKTVDEKQVKEAAEVEKNEYAKQIEDVEIEKNVGEKQVKKVAKVEKTEHMKRDEDVVEIEKNVDVKQIKEVAIESGLKEEDNTTDCILIEELEDVTQTHSLKHHKEALKEEKENQIDTLYILNSEVLNDNICLFKSDEKKSEIKENNDVFVLNENVAVDRPTNDSQHEIVMKKGHEDETQTNVEYLNLQGHMEMEEKENKQNNKKLETNHTHGANKKQPKMDKGDTKKIYSAQLKELTEVQNEQKIFEEKKKDTDTKKKVLQMEKNIFKEYEKSDRKGSMDIVEEISIADSSQVSTTNNTKNKKRDKDNIKNDLKFDKQKGKLSADVTKQVDTVSNIANEKKKEENETSVVEREGTNDIENEGEKEKEETREEEEEEEEEEAVAMRTRSSKRRQEMQKIINKKREENKVKTKGKEIFKKIEIKRVDEGKKTEIKGKVASKKISNRSKMGKQNILEPNISQNEGKREELKVFDTEVIGKKGKKSDPDKTSLKNVTQRLVTTQKRKARTNPNKEVLVNVVTQDKAISQEGNISYSEKKENASAKKTKEIEKKDTSSVNEKMKQRYAQKNTMVDGEAKKDQKKRGKYVAEVGTKTKGKAKEQEKEQEEQENEKEKKETVTKNMKQKRSLVTDGKEKKHVRQKTEHFDAKEKKPNDMSEKYSEKENDDEDSTTKDTPPYGLPYGSSFLLESIRQQLKEYDLKLKYDETLRGALNSDLFFADSDKSENIELNENNGLVKWRERHEMATSKLPYNNREVELQMNKEKGNIKKDEWHDRKNQDKTKQQNKQDTEKTSEIRRSEKKKTRKQKSITGLLEKENRKENVNKIITSEHEMKEDRKEKMLKEKKSKDESIMHEQDPKADFSCMLSKQENNQEDKYGEVNESSGGVHGISKCRSSIISKKAERREYEIIVNKINERKVNEPEVKGELIHKFSTSENENKSENGFIERKLNSFLSNTLDKKTNTEEAESKFYEGDDDEEYNEKRANQKDKEDMFASFHEEELCFDENADILFEHSYVLSPFKRASCYDQGSLHLSDLKESNYLKIERIKEEGNQKNTSLHKFVKDQNNHEMSIRNKETPIKNRLLNDKAEGLDDSSILAGDKMKNKNSSLNEYFNDDVSALDEPQKVLFDRQHDCEDKCVQENKKQELHSKSDDKDKLTYFNNIDEKTKRKKWARLTWSNLRKLEEQYNNQNDQQLREELNELCQNIVRKNEKIHNEKLERNDNVTFQNTYEVYFNEHIENFNKDEKCKIVIICIFHHYILGGVHVINPYNNLEFQKYEMFVKDQIMQTDKQYTHIYKYKSSDFKFAIKDNTKIPLLSKTQNQPRILEVFSKLGKGANGCIYRCKLEGQLVACKVQTTLRIAKKEIYFSYLMKSRKFNKIKKYKDNIRQGYSQMDIFLEVYAYMDKFIFPDELHYSEAHEHTNDIYGEKKQDADADVECVRTDLEIVKVKKKESKKKKNKKKEDINKGKCLLLMKTHKSVITLNDFINLHLQNNKNTVSEEVILFFLHQIIVALLQLHILGVLHGDVKIDNVLVSKNKHFFHEHNGKCDAYSTRYNKEERNHVRTFKPDEMEYTINEELNTYNENTFLKSEFPLNIFLIDIGRGIDLKEHKRFIFEGEKKNCDCYRFLTDSLFNYHIDLIGIAQIASGLLFFKHMSHLKYKFDNNIDDTNQIQLNNLTVTYATHNAHFVNNQKKGQAVIGEDLCDDKNGVVKANDKEHIERLSSFTSVFDSNHFLNKFEEKGTILKDKTEKELEKREKEGKKKGNSTQENEYYYYADFSKNLAVDENNKKKIHFYFKKIKKEQGGNYFVKKDKEMKIKNFKVKVNCDRKKYKHFWNMFFHVLLNFCNIYELKQVKYNNEMELKERHHQGNNMDNLALMEDAFKKFFSQIIIKGECYFDFYENNWLELNSENEQLFFRRYIRKKCPHINVTAFESWKNTFLQNKQSILDSSANNECRNVEGPNMLSTLKGVNEYSVHNFIKQPTGIDGNDNKPTEFNKYFFVQNCISNFKNIRRKLSTHVSSTTNVPTNTYKKPVNGAPVEDKFSKKRKMVCLEQERTKTKCRKLNDINSYKENSYATIKESTIYVNKLMKKKDIILLLNLKRLIEKIFDDDPQKQQILSKELFRAASMF